MHFPQAVSFLTISLPCILLSQVNGCIMPKGIEIECPEGSTTCLPLSAFDGLPDDPDFSFFATAVGTILSVQPGLYGYETPVQNHLTSACMIPIYGAAAAFHDTALETFGRAEISDDRRRCKPNEGEDGIDEDLWQLHRKVMLMYSVFWAMSEILPWTKPAGGAAAVLNPLFEQWNIDPTICSDKEGVLENCDDASTPWGLARVMIDETLDFMKRDGWNHMGDLPKVSYNKVPYADWRSFSERFIPKNSPWVLTNERHWQPLLEHNKQGFMFHQEHVVPHIGETARSIFLGDDDICQRDLEDPAYDLNLESELALERTRDLTEIQKVEIEYFDNKLASLFPLLVQQYVRMGYHLDSFEFIVAEATNIHALREATIVVWRQKVKHNLVRPTSYIHAKMNGQKMTSYGGPDSVGEEKEAGPVEIMAEEWQPYIRVMPHAEFPSGSSCFCRTFADTIASLTGSYDVTELIGGPLVDFRSAGSSVVEAGLPKQNVTLMYESWTDIVARCGDTRLEGGMHFSASVPAGEDLCSGIGNTVVDAFRALEHGESPDYLVDFDDSDLSGEPRCSPVESSDTFAEMGKTDAPEVTKVLAIVFGVLFGVSLVFIGFIFIMYLPKVTGKKRRKSDDTFKQTTHTRSLHETAHERGENI